MEDYEVLDNGVPNVAFGNMCEKHFYSLTSPFAGNIGIYTFITVFFPALILFIIGRYKFKDLIDEYNRYNKKLFILSGLTWALMLISSVKAYATGSVVIVAAMLSLTGVINSIIEFIIKRNKKEFLKKVLISILILIGIILIKYWHLKLFSVIMYASVEEEK